MCHELYCGGSGDLGRLRWRYRISTLSLLGWSVDFISLALLSSLNFAEGGQSSSGSVLSWARRELFRGEKPEDPIPYKILDREASEVGVGAQGLVALETFQGSRTPVTDPLARGYR